MTDIHTHVLPGVDDGSDSIRESVIMLKMSIEQGFDHVIATPHYNINIARSADPYKFIERLEKKKETLEAEVIKRFGKRTGNNLCSEKKTVGPGLKENEGSVISLSLGMEIQYFEELPQYLDQGKALTLAGSRYVLIEFLPEDDYMRIKRAVYNLLQDSYLPVIAHIERYACLRKKGYTDELKAMGAYLQINTSGFGRGFFSRDTIWCKKEILKGNVDFLATDMHNVRTRPPETAAALKWLSSERAAAGLREKLLINNPRHILDDELF